MLAETIEHGVMQQACVSSNTFRGVFHGEEVKSPMGLCDFSITKGISPGLCAVIFCSAQFLSCVLI